MQCSKQFFRRIIWASVYFLFATAGAGAFGISINGSGPDMVFQERFVRPPMPFRPNLNRHGVSAVLSNDVQLMETKTAEGYGGFACNVNWTADYLQNDAEFVKFFNFCFAAKDRNMNLWLYDEYWYPSGMAKTQILDAHPDREVQGLKFKQVAVSGAQRVALVLPPGQNLLIKAVPVQTGVPQIAQALDLAVLVQGSNLVWDAPAGDWIVAAVSADVLREGYQAGQNRGGNVLNYPSLLMPEVTQQFIELTHKKYAEKLGWPLGSIFFSTFTDEPSLMGQAFKGQECGTYPWKTNLSEEISLRYGWQVNDRLLELMLDDGPNGKRLRYQYFCTVADLLSRNYFRAIREYCASQGFLSGGHLLLEESLLAHVPLYGSIFSCYRELDVPGIDILTDVPGKTRAYLYSARLAASSAELKGNNRVMLELCPVGKEGTVEQARGTYFRSMIGGVTLFNSYHKLTNATPEEKYILNTSLARISAAMSGGSRAADIAVFYPVETAWTVYKPVPAWNGSWWTTAGASPAARQVETVFNAVSDFLYDHQREFSYVDSSALCGAGVETGTLRFGEGLNRKVLILPQTDTLPLAAWEKVREFWRQGGTVIAVGTLPANSESNFPSLTVQGMASEVFSGNINSNGGLGVYLPVLDTEEVARILDSRLARAFTVIPSGSEVLTAYRVIDGRHCIFLLNDRASEQTVEFKWNGAGTIEQCNPQTGEIQIAGNPVQVTMAAYDGRILRIIPVAK